jgi:nitronate monooxygenase
MWNRNELTKKLGIKYPIIQGPFGGGFSTALLTSTVSNYGGLGSFGAHNLTAKQIIEKISEIKSLTTQPFAVNLWISNEDEAISDLKEATYLKVAQAYKDSFDQMNLKPPPHTDHFSEKYEEQIEALIQTKPPVFSFVFGIPEAQILDRCRKAGIQTIGAATTVAEALAIEKAGVDFILASGFEAGGHRPSFLKSAEESLMGTATLVSQIVAKVKIPVIAAGGLSTARDLVAAYTLGAQGFQLGTAFLACEESGASHFHREAIFSDKATTTTLSRSYTGRLARFINNSFLEKSKRLDLPLLPYPAQNYLFAELKKRAAENGRTDLSPLYAGQGAPLLKYRKVKDLMRSLVEEFQVELNKIGENKNV